MAANRSIQISELLQDDRNANRGTARGAAMIARSLADCGAGRSILLDKNGKIIAGNKTAVGASALGLEDVRIIESDGSALIAVKRTDLDLDTDPRARELALMDNRTSEVSLDWDEGVLAAFADNGLDLSAMFTDEELAALVGAAEESAPAALDVPDEFASVDESLETAYQCPKCGYEWSGQPK